MDTDETKQPRQEQSEKLLPAWLHPDDDEMPPAALQVIYAKLDQAVTRVCERARKAMRNEFVRGILAVHAALAPRGLFKDWCAAAGINYRTAHSIIARSDVTIQVDLHSRREERMVSR
jgi:hypothetical protein